MISNLVEIAGGQFESVAELDSARKQLGEQKTFDMVIIDRHQGQRPRLARTFAITEHGFEVRSKLEGVTGLLGWSALATVEPVLAPGGPRRRKSDIPPLG